MFAVLTTEIAGMRVPGITTEDGAVTTTPVGEVPVAVPVLEMLPLSTSACVVVYVAVQVVDAPGASVVMPPQLITDRPECGSVTPTAWRVTFPVLVTL